MAIQPIEEADWDAIVQLQSEVYHQIEPESRQTLRSKWLNSPHCCFVFRLRGEVQAYLLAHAWPQDNPPKLYQDLAAQGTGRNLFLHDLAVSPVLSGKGVGKRMVCYLLERASRADFRQVLLVAVQDSVPFWSGLGFSVCAKQQASPEYGVSARVMRLKLQAVSAN